ncbi:MAG: tetratricopeptide repeat protein [Mycobacteriales bacterium]|nr:MAG: co-chaperone YbbN [Pseudonocardiales bacterium]
MSASLAAGAVDLGALKSRTEARDRAAANPPGAGGGEDGFVIDVTEETFQADVLERSMQVPVVLDLWASWCEPCKQLGPVLEKLAAEGNGTFVLAKIDIDANPAIAQALRVQSIPAVKAVFQGQLVAEFTGALPEPDVRKWIGALVDAISGAPPDGALAEEPAQPPEPGQPPEPPEDLRFAPAEDALARGDFAGAEAALEAVLAERPADAEATRMLRGVQLHRRVDAAAPDAVSRADAAPDDVEAGLAAADVQVGSGEVSGGFDRLIALVRATSGEDRTRVRTRLLELFTAVGDDDAEVAAARRALSSALF